MAKVIFWDVDTQVDFMNPDGKLPVPSAPEIVGSLKALTDHAVNNGILVVASVDDHSESDPELSDEPDYQETFPPHCMRGTGGQKKIPETTIEHSAVIPAAAVESRDIRAILDSGVRSIILTKSRFDVFSNQNAQPLIDAIRPDRIVVFGVALDVCNRHAIEGMLQCFPGIGVTLVTDATRAIDESKVSNLLSDWEARGVELLTTSEVIHKYS